VPGSRTGYDPYGAVHYGGALPTDFTFTGQRAEGFGLYDYRARWYDPALGRFVSADTVVPEPGNPQALNRYAYVTNNPLRYTDPSGHAVCLDEGCRLVMHPTTGEVVVRVNSLEEWREAIVTLLMNAGPICQHAAQVILERDVQIGFAAQPHSGARWTLSGDIELAPDMYSFADVSAELLGAIAHEATHLEQGLFLRLSVEGEARGWTAEFGAREELEQAGLGGRILDPHWENIAGLPTSLTDRDLRYARSEMLAYDSGYRIWLAPLRPESWLLFFITPLGPLLAYHGIP
jgi:RHS repeat-associated protein